jgi:hypothetical protein
MSANAKDDAILPKQLIPFTRGKLEEYMNYWVTNQQYERQLRDLRENLQYFQPIETVIAQKAQEFK